MFSVIFPQHNGQRYYAIHYLYVLNILKYLNCNITFREGLDIDTTAFKCSIDGKNFVFDFGDSSEVRDLGDFPVFKFHTKLTDMKVIPFPPVSFYDWQQYNWLSKQIYYIPTISSEISCRQRPYAGALERRIKVQKLLRDNFKDDVLTDIIDQVKYWREINEIESSVFVPGQNNNMLDRGHLQYLAFGCYTISPYLPEILPYNRLIVPGVHYCQCKDDYSDLIDIIMQKKLNSNQTEYKEIGENAKKLFQETCTPEAIGKWIQSKC
jgi:hypothetical protein